MAVEPDHQGALRLLGLALTDQFVGGAADRHIEAENVFERLRDPYEKLYYAGIVHERRAKALLTAGARPHTVTVLFEEAMTCFEKPSRSAPKATTPRSCAGTAACDSSSSTPPTGTRSPKRSTRPTARRSNRRSRLLGTCACGRTGDRLGRMRPRSLRSRAASAPQREALPLGDSSRCDRGKAVTWTDSRKVES